MWCSLKKIWNKIVDDINLTNDEIIALSKMWNIDELLSAKHPDVTKFTSDATFNSLDALHLNIVSMIEKAHSSDIDDISKMIKLKEHKIRFEDQFKDLIKKSSDKAKDEYRFAYENIQSYLYAMTDSHAFKKLTSEFKRNNMNYTDIEKYLDNEILKIESKSDEVFSKQRYAIYSMKENYYNSLFKDLDVDFITVNQKDLDNKNSSTVFRTNNLFDKVNTKDDLWGLPDRTKSIITDPNAKKVYIINDLADHSWGKNYTTIKIDKDKFLPISEIFYWNKELDKDVNYFIWQWTQYQFFDMDWWHVIFRDWISSIDSKFINNENIAKFLDSKNVTELDLNISKDDNWFQVTQRWAYWLEWLLVDNWIYSIVKENNVTDFITLSNQAEDIAIWNFRFENKVNLYNRLPASKLNTDKRFNDYNFKNINKLVENVWVTSSDTVSFWKAINSTFLISNLSNKYISTLKKIIWENKFNELLREQINLKETLASWNAFKNIQINLIEKARNLMIIANRLSFEKQNKEFLDWIKELNVEDKIKEVYQKFNWIAKHDELEAYILSIAWRSWKNPYKVFSKVPIYIKEKFIPSMDKAIFNEVFWNLLEKAWVTKEVFNKEFANIKDSIIDLYYVWKNKDSAISKKVSDLLNTEFKNRKINKAKGLNTYSNDLNIAEFKSYKSFVNDWWANKAMIFDFFTELKREWFINKDVDLIKLTEAIEWKEKRKLINAFQKIWKEELFSNVNREYKVTQILSDIIKKNKLKDEADLISQEWLSKWEALETSLKLADDNKDIIVDYITANLPKIQDIFKKTLKNIDNNLDIIPVKKSELIDPNLENVFNILPFNYKLSVFSKAKQNEMWNLLVDKGIFKWVSDYITKKDVWWFLTNFSKWYNELNAFNLLDTLSWKDYSVWDFKFLFNKIDSYFQIWNKKYITSDLFKNNKYNVEFYDLLTDIVDWVVRNRAWWNIEWALRQWEKVADWNFDLFQFYIWWHPRPYNDKNITEHPLFWVIRELYWIKKSKDLWAIDMYLQPIKQNLDIPLFKVWASDLSKSKIRLKEAIYKYENLFSEQTHTIKEWNNVWKLYTVTKQELSDRFVDTNISNLIKNKSTVLKEYTPVIEKFEDWKYTYKVLDRTSIENFDWEIIKNTDEIFWETSSSDVIKNDHIWYWDYNQVVDIPNLNYEKEITLWDISEPIDWMKYIFESWSWKSKKAFQIEYKKWNYYITEWKVVDWKKHFVEKIYNEKWILDEWKTNSINKATKHLDDACIL